MTRLVLGFVGLAFGLQNPSPTPVAPRMTLSEVLVFRLSDTMPGPLSRAHILRADRGGHRGQYLLMTTTETKEDVVQREPGAIGGAEYHLLSPEKVGPLPEVDVVGFHFIKVRPDRRQAFERFVAQKLHPAVANLRPDLRLLYYKPVKGNTRGNYLAVFALTKGSRDKYWPGGSDSGELREAFSPSIRALTKELSTYLVEGSFAADPALAAAVYESREWTDFVLIQPMPPRRDPAEMER
jgi:hypothetical protein